MSGFQRLVLTMGKANENQWGRWASFYLNYCEEEMYNEKVFKETGVSLWIGFYDSTQYSVMDGRFNLIFITTMNSYGLGL